MQESTGPKNLEELGEPGELMSSSIFRIVGGSEDDQIEVAEMFHDQMHQYSDKKFKVNGKVYELNKIEREKTDEETRVVGIVLDYVKKFLTEKGYEPLEIKPEHVHFLDVQKMADYKLPAVSFFEPIEQFMAIYSRGSLLANMQEVVHEAMHFQSFSSIQIGKGDSFDIRRSGFGFNVRGEKREYFGKINEAIMVELEKAVDSRYFNQIPEIRDDLERRKRLTDQLLQQFPQKHDLLKDIACFVLEPNSGLYSAMQFPYANERANLNALVDEIYIKNKDQFENRDDVLNLFIAVSLGGRALDLARIIEKTYGKGSFKETKKAHGKGSFRKLGEDTKIEDKTL